MLFGFSACFTLGTNLTDLKTPCPDYGTVEFAKVKTVNIGNNLMVVRFECEPGYHLFGKHKLLCVDGQWEQVPGPQCVDSVCRAPQDISNGIISLEGENNSVGYYKKGTLVTYTCNDGYKLVPPESKYRVCEKDIWTGAMGKCVPIGCKPPKDIENGYYVTEKNGVVEEFSSGQRMYSVGQRVYYSCNSGYILTGDVPVQQCVEDGTWSPKIPPLCALEINGKFFLYVYYNNY